MREQLIETTYLEQRLVVTIGDITEEKTDAIVNAANYTLLGGGGVDGAIHHKGGKKIYEECLHLRNTIYPKGLPTGEAVITTGGNLPAKNVIHTVGPIFGQHGGREAELLAACYKNCLVVAANNNLSSIAFPSISTGAFHYPKHQAAKVASSAIAEFLLNDNKIRQIRLIFFAESDARMFNKHQNFS